MLQFVSVLVSSIDRDGILLACDCARLIAERQARFVPGRCAAIVVDLAAWERLLWSEGGLTRFGAAVPGPVSQ
ncbi:MAG: hypothetical protein FJX77_11750 [Armatimonadetes bacterium]|nr:hypothetical protein [Armatimonadota bacterium]